MTHGLISIKGKDMRYIVKLADGSEFTGTRKWWYSLTESSGSLAFTDVKFSDRETRIPKLFIPIRSISYYHKV